jgi:hypothetical protein
MTRDYEGYQIVPEGSYALYTIKRKGSGPAPKSLRGLFGSVELAKKEIDSYLRVKQKGSSNASSSSPSSG